jgi:hypothetical protein
MAQLHSVAKLVMREERLKRDSTSIIASARRGQLQTNTTFMTEQNTSNNTQNMKLDMPFT